MTSTGHRPHPATDDAFPAKRPERWCLYHTAMLCCIWLIPTGRLVAQSTQAPPSVTTDTSYVASSDTTNRAHSPRGALVRSLVVPGWGQLYNRQWYKMPFVYAALAGTSILAARNHRLHRNARHAFLFATGTSSDPNPYAEYEEAYLAFEGASADRLFEHKNALRRNRDVSYFSIAVVYLLSVLDAYVNGQLYEFDTSEDLSVHFQPVREGAALHVRLRW